MPERERHDPIEPPDAIEPGVEQHDVPTLLQTIENLTAIIERKDRLLAERASPITWLTSKAAANRALLGDTQMRRWEKWGWVNSKREGRNLYIDQDSLDARLRRLGRKPYLGK
jgi:hypothetical protein